MPSIIGFHAGPREFAERLQSGQLSLDDWRYSANEYDWLGDGIYFWENSYRRALEWARQHGFSSIIEAEIDLGTCFDLTNSDYVDLLHDVYTSLKKLYREEGWTLPKNKKKLRNLDRLVINQFVQLMENGYGGEAVVFQTVRCPFEEGKRLFAGSMIRRQTHIQVAVRDRVCIRQIEVRFL